LIFVFDVESSCFSKKLSLLFRRFISFW